jgi:hypothetical protein
MNKFEQGGTIETEEKLKRLEEVMSKISKQANRHNRQIQKKYE